MADGLLSRSNLRVGWISWNSVSYYVDVLYDTNKKSYVLIVVGSEPCPYMARISHDPPRSNYVVVLKIEDKSHACSRSSIKVRAAYQQLLLHSYIYIYIYPTNWYQVSYLSDSLYPLRQDCLAYGFASSCWKQRKSVHLESWTAPSGCDVVFSSVESEDVKM